MTPSPIRDKVRSAALLLPITAFVLTASLASAELAVWDQAKVTAIAAELVAATKDLRGALRKQQPPTLGQPGMASFHRLRDELSAIETAAGRLHRALAEGGTRDETFPTYRRMIRSVRNAAEDARRISIGEPAAGKIKAAGDVLRRLRPYYEEEPPV
jgi:hypothetical protein